MEQPTSKDAKILGANGQPVVTEEDKKAAAAMEELKGVIETMMDDPVIRRIGAIFSLGARLQFWSESLLSKMDYPPMGKQAILEILFNSMFKPDGTPVEIEVKDLVLHTEMALQFMRGDLTADIARSQAETVESAPEAIDKTPEDAPVGDNVVEFKRVDVDATEPTEA